MTAIEQNLYEQLKNSKIGKVDINYEGKNTKITFDVIAEIPELNERITLENASYKFCRAIIEIAQKKS